MNKATKTVLVVGLIATALYLAFRKPAAPAAPEKA